jgi:hypothetical protein
MPDGVDIILERCEMRASVFLRYNGSHDLSVFGDGIGTGRMDCSEDSGLPLGVGGSGAASAGALIPASAILKNGYKNGKGIKIIYNAEVKANLK